MDNFMMGETLISYSGPSLWSSPYGSLSSVVIVEAVLLIMLILIVLLLIWN